MKKKIDQGSEDKITETFAGSEDNKTSGVDLSQIEAGERETQTPHFDEVVELRGTETSDGGYFPNRAGAMIIGHVIDVREVESDFGEERQVPLPGGAVKVKTQTVYVIRGSQRVPTDEGMITQVGTFKVTKTSRLIDSMKRFVENPNLIVRITVTGKEPDRTIKNGERRSGAYTYDVMEMRRIKK